LPWSEGTFDNSAKPEGSTNRVGKEDCLDFAGESFVCGPDGEVVARGKQSEDDIVYAEIDYTKVAASNARRLFLKHRRPELYGDWLGK
jgi:N-carbamoylputrescine amidase